MSTARIRSAVGSLSSRYQVHGGSESRAISRTGLTGPPARRRQVKRFVDPKSTSSAASLLGSLGLAHPLLCPREPRSYYPVFSQSGVSPWRLPVLVTVSRSSRRLYIQGVPCACCPRGSAPRRVPPQVCGQRRTLRERKNLDWDRFFRVPRSFEGINPPTRALSDSPAHRAFERRSLYHLVGQGGEIPAQIGVMGVCIEMRRTTPPPEAAGERGG